MKHKDREIHAAASTVKSTQEAEFAVLSSITVREEHKTKLRFLLSIIEPAIFPHSKSLTKSRHKKSKPQVPEGKEIHVLGDLLLLIRAASVDVVENIQAWRTSIHEGIPRPYMYNHENYLLSMCEDVDFLDQVGDLVEWLGFRLVRNPFIVDKALDDVVSSRLPTRVHEARSLKYWNSTSWRQNNKFTSQQGSVPSASTAVVSQSKSASKARWKKHPPPPPLVKPLANISPEDDVVDGSRIAAAQDILLEEESFHGRLLGIKAATEYVDRGPSVFQRDGIGNIVDTSTVYEAISVLNAQQKVLEYRSSLLRRERSQIERTIQDFKNQVAWTELRRGCDCTKEHRSWHCRDIYRQEVLKLYDKLVDRLGRCLSELNDEENRFEDALDKHRGRMSELRVEKEKQRVARHEKKQVEEVMRREGIRKKTEERISKLRPKQKNLQKRRQSDPKLSEERSNQKNSKTYEDIAVDIESDIRVLVERKSNIPAEVHEDPEFTAQRLEEKRQRSLYQKRARLEQQARIVKEKELVLDRRRAENAAMKWEDNLSRVVEREAKRRVRLRNQKEMMDRAASRAMFKCMHEMNGKQFLISVYTRNARGYDLEGLRIVAYDPSSSATFTLGMALREFNSLGYGRTSDGLGAFCKWLCLLYEKRRRQFRLVWSGTPCPPPLRVRENDQALVCVHKEGVRMRHTSTGSYSLVAVYLRTDELSTVRFVVGSWHAHEFLLTEHAMASHRLVIGSDLDIQWRSAGHAMIVWKHHASNFNNEEQQQDSAEPTSTTTVGRRIYSGEVVVSCVRYSVHLYDTTETGYTVELIPKPRKGEHIQELVQPTTNRLKLCKREVNPYDVHLSSSNFADLMSLTRFELTPILEPTMEADTNDLTSHLKWKATISPKWAGKLAKYVRVLRLTKYACKIGGVFCFMAVFVVQQKSEFRAHLLLEITWLTPILSSSFSFGGAATRQSLRIALSDYLQCLNASRRFAVELRCESDSGEECPTCVAYTAARTTFYKNRLTPVPEAISDNCTRCSNCAITQRRRLYAIKDLIIQAGAVTPELLDIIYHGHCAECATLASPIVLVLGSALSTTMMTWLLPLLEHYFACFDSSNNGFLPSIDGDEGHSIADETVNIRDTFLQTLSRDQVIVLYNADCGVTVASANMFVNELHWWLYPDCADLPCHVAYVVGSNKVDESATDDRRDYDLLDALRVLNHAACQVAELDPVKLDDGGEEENDRASAFDAYLVAEAVLVEATRVLLHPDYKWQKPRKIVGASSWSTACGFLLGPVQLSGALQRCNILQLSEATSEVLEAYFVHTKWPYDYPDVRPIFYGLLTFMMCVQHVRQILTLKSGSLQCSALNQREMTAEIEQLAKNTSAIDCSQRSSTTAVSETSPR